MDRSNIRGVDTKFKREGMVLIGCTPDNIGAYSQMMGRSSRQRKPLNGIYFALSNETPEVIYTNLQKNDFEFCDKLVDLLHALKYLSKKERSTVAKAYTDDRCLALHSLEHLQTVIGVDAVGKLIVKSGL